MRRSLVSPALVLLLGALPAGYLLATSMAGIEGAAWDQMSYRPFVVAAGRSFRLFGAVAMLGMVVGWPLGTLAGSLRFPLKGLGLGLLALPLMLPPFLWAIGIQSLQPYIGFSRQVWWDGFRGCCWTGTAVVVPLTVAAVWTALRQVRNSEVDALTLVMGPGRRTVWLFLRGFPAALGAALTGALLAVSDPGPGQIMGYPGLCGDILVAFAGRNDFQAAAVKSLSASLLFLPVIALALGAILSGIDFANLGKPINRWGGIALRPAWRALASLVFVALPLLMVLLPFAGLVRPLLTPPRERALQDAWKLFAESLGTTLSYGAVAGLMATGLGLVVAVGCRRDRRIIPWAAGLALVLVALPSSLTALGVVKLGSSAPPWLDVLVRGPLTVGFALGLRFLPVALLLLLGPVLQVPRSGIDAARLLPMRRTARWGAVLLPMVAAPCMVAFAAVAFLTLADVASTVLIQPPGGSSFGTHLFAVMDNSSEKVVSSLCLVYSALPIGAWMLIGGVWLATMFQRNSLKLKIQ